MGLYLLPPSLVEKFARENPRLAMLILLFGLGLLGFVVWIVASDWLSG